MARRMRVCSLNGVLGWREGVHLVGCCSPPALEIGQQQPPCFQTQGRMGASCGPAPLLYKLVASVAAGVSSSGGAWSVRLPHGGAPWPMPRWVLPMPCWAHASLGVAHARAPRCRSPRGPASR